MTRGKLVLFDIDGTLLSAGRAPRRAITRALKDVFSITDSLDGLPPTSFAGKTDPEIVRSILERNHYPANNWKKKLPEFFERYLQALREELPGEKKARLYPGVRELLDDLSSSGRAVLGLLTGNIREGAYIKLSHFGIDRYFTAGGFGSDSPNRRELTAFAMRRVKESTGREFTSRDIVIIGDTFEDILVSKEAHARSVIVTTGFFTREELAKAEPDYLFEDFSNTTAVIEAVLS